MDNICLACGAWRADKTIDPSGPAAICPACGHRQPFRMLPLLLVGGASGAGKSTVCQALLGTLSAVVVLDADLLWAEHFNQPEQSYRPFFETWLRVAKSIAQAGRPVLLFGAGIGVPSNIEPCVERRYFDQIHYGALVCDDAALRERLQARPAWRQAGSAEFAASQQQFNRWLHNYADEPPITRFDTTGASLAETSAAVRVWALAASGGGATS